MPIKSDVRKAVTKIATALDQNDYRSERDVERAIIDYLIEALGWDIRNAREVESQRPIDGGREGNLQALDIALHDGKTHHNKEHPLVFIEAKAVGKMDSARERNKGEVQLFGYANKDSVPLLILTDGRKWRFYLYFRKGKQFERVFWEGRISKEKEAIDECTKAFCTYLSRRSVINGTAQRKAGEILDKRIADKEDKNTEVIRQSVQEAWKSLLEEQPWRLRSLLQKKTAEKFPNLLGLNPIILKDFLSTQAQKIRVSKRVSHVIQPSKKTVKDSSASVPRPNNPASSLRYQKIIGFSYDRKNHLTKSGTEALLQALVLFQENDSSFLQRLNKKHEKIVNQKRSSLFLQGKSEKYVASGSRQILIQGKVWWAYVKLDNGGIERVLKKACVVKGITYGKDFKILTEPKD